MQCSQQQTTDLLVWQTGIRRVPQCMELMPNCRILDLSFNAEELLGEIFDRFGEDWDSRLQGEGPLRAGRAWR